MAHRKVLIVNEDLGLPVRVENRYEEAPRMATAAFPGVEVVDEQQREDILGNPVITEIIREPNEPTEERFPHGRILHDGDLAVLVRTIYQGDAVYAPAGQVVMVLTRDPNEASTIWGEQEFIRCMMIGGGEMGIMGTCLMSISYNGDSAQAHELMALFGGQTTLIEREVS